MATLRGVPAVSRKRVNGRSYAQKRQMDSEGVDEGHTASQETYATFLGQLPTVGSHDTPVFR
jgi:hypothetical protein